MRLRRERRSYQVDSQAIDVGLPTVIALEFESTFRRRFFETRELGVRLRRSTIAGSWNACGEQAIAG